MRLLTVAVVLLAPAVATADDSSAALGAGGLALTRSADIRMSAEELKISPREVSAKFIFVNDSRHDIDTMVAFVLPDIDTSRFSEEPLGVTTKDPVNFVGFDVRENGRKIPFETEQRAFYEGRDVTQIVRGAGVPLNIVDPGFTKILDGLPPSKSKMLESAGLVDRESGEGLHPHWTVRTRFFWRQTFPAGRAVILDESYHPVTGQALFGASELRPGSEDGRFYLKTYCIDPSSGRTLARMIADKIRADPKGGGYLTALTTDYVLTTGNNWKGPIGHFHLVLDKLEPRNVLSLCWDGALAHAGPATFESTRENFAPKGDLKILVLQQAPLRGPLSASDR
ncbi:MAG TPA: DUF4424 family protein [Rhizomicrobium sp.]